MRAVPRKTRRPEGVHRGQSTIEFTFAAIILLLLVYGMVQSVRWVIMDAAQRRYMYEMVITNVAQTAEHQLNPQAQQVLYPDLEYR